VEEPESFLRALQEAGVKGHLFTFLQEPHECEPKYQYYSERDGISILPISTYENWLTKQIDAKTRNMVRKAGKKGVVLRPTECDRPFIEGVVSIYNEVAVRQGRRFLHYGIDYEGAKAHLETFASRTSFVGAYLNEELVGFFKLTRNKNSASVMQIISKVSVRDSAPNNALLSKAVEMCAELKIPYLQYGIWGKGGLAEYKKSHGFVRFDIPRYYVPLTGFGKLALQYRLHRGLASLLPEKQRDRLVAIRNAWNARRQSHG
jgi:hypothetical protein